MGDSVKKVWASGDRSLSAWRKIEGDEREDYVPSLLTLFSAARSLARSLKKTRKELARLQSAHEALLHERAPILTAPGGPVIIDEMVLRRGYTLGLIDTTGDRIRRISEEHRGRFVLHVDDEPIKLHTIDDGVGPRADTTRGQLNLASVSIRRGDIFWFPGYVAHTVSAIERLSPECTRVRLDVPRNEPKALYIIEPSWPDARK